MNPGNRIAWVTGASSGIGRAAALKLARKGWTVAVSARGAEALASIEDEARAQGRGRAIAFPLDVTDDMAVAGTVARIWEEIGPIDLALLSAGTFEPDDATTLSLERFRKTIDVNLVGTAACVAALVPRWRERGRGHLAVVSSVAGFRGLPTSISYSASKAALIAMCEAMKFDFDRMGLKIQVVSPGFVKTPLTDRNRFPMPFLMDVDVAADRLVAGLEGRRFAFTFPRRFTVLMKLLRILPYSLYFPIVRWATGK